MKTKALAFLTAACAPAAACSSTSSGASTQRAATSDSRASASGPTGAPSPSSATSASVGSSSSAGSSCSCTPTASDKPVAALLAHWIPDGPTAGWGSVLDSRYAPKACPEWIAAVAKSDSDGEPIASDDGISVNLVALVDEAAKTEDLDSLAKICGTDTDCNELQKLMPAKDPSGRTGFERLSELLEKTHPARAIYTDQIKMEYPGFTAFNHTASDQPLTALDHQDLKLLGVSGQNYHGLRTSFEAHIEHSDGDPNSNTPIGWDGVYVNHQ